MALATGKVEHAELDAFERDTGATSVAVALAKRLEPREFTPLLTLWCEMPSACGLRSNMGAQCERLAALPRTAKREPEPQDELAARAAQAEAAWDHSDELPPKELSPVPCERRRRALAHSSTARYAASWWNARDGLHGTQLPGDVRAARGVERPMMAIAGAVSVMPTHDGAAEAWVHRRSRKRDGDAYESTPDPHALPDAEKWTFRTPPLEHGKMLDREQAPVERAYHALQRMIAAGREENVYVLYAFYAQAAPPTEFPAFGDLACLVLATPTVLSRAAKMTRDHRRSGSPCQILLSREYVTARTAAHDLLDAHADDSPEAKAQRVAAKNAIKREAEAMLIRASEDFRAMLRAK